MVHEYADIAIRLFIATVIGASIGLNRDFHHKPTGLRTLALVALGSALLVMAGAYSVEGGSDFNGTSRIIQGIITGIGFLGAGVILRGQTDHKISGFTTAATIWLTAGFGIMAGLGAWPELIIAVSLAWTVLVLGGVIERRFNKKFLENPDTDQ